jgi:hypothetical protein
MYAASEYTFRLPVMPKGSFFSILLVKSVVGVTPANKLEKLAELIRQEPLGTHQSTLENMHFSRYRGHKFLLV